VSESSKENFVYSLATKVPNIDVIVFGHTHRAFGPYKLNNTVLVQPPSYGKGVALIEIADGKVTRVQNVDLYGIEDDPEILDMFWSDHRKPTIGLTKSLALLQKISSVTHGNWLLSRFKPVLGCIALCHRKRNCHAPT